MQRPMKVKSQASLRGLTIRDDDMAKLIEPRRIGANTMKSYTEHLTMNVPKRMGFVNITPQVEAAVKKSGVQEGLVLVQRDAHHRSRVHQRRRAGPARRLSAVAGGTGPLQSRRRRRYHHNRTGEDNADAHLKRQIMGREVVVAITEGQARLRPVGADFLRRVRRPPRQSGC